MAGKLYWRVKKNGKWTWKKAKFNMVDVDYEHNQMYCIVDLDNLTEEE